MCFVRSRTRVDGEKMSSVSSLHALSERAKRDTRREMALHMVCLEGEEEGTRREESNIRVCYFCIWRGSECLQRIQADGCCSAY